MSEINFNVISVLILGVIFGAVFIALWWVRKEVDPVKRAFNGFTLMILAFGVSILTLWFALPSIPVLGTFGSPDAEQIKSFDEVHKHLLIYHKALLETTRVVHLFLIMFVVWFLTSLYWFSRVMAISVSKVNNENEKT